MTAGARGREDGDGDVRYRAWTLWSHLPGRMDDEDVAAADLKDMGRRTGIWVSLIKLGLKSRALQRAMGVKGGQGSMGEGSNSGVDSIGLRGGQRLLPCPVLH